MKRWIFNFLVIVFLLPTHLINAQGVKASGQSMQDSLALLKMEISRLKEQNKVFGSRLDSLISAQAIGALTEDSDDDIKKLLEEASLLSEKEEVEVEHVNKRFLSGVRQQQGLNPNISLGGDFFGDSVLPAMNIFPMRAMCSMGITDFFSGK